MAKPKDKPAAAERIEVDEPRLKALAGTIVDAIRVPEGITLFEKFQGVGTVEDRKRTRDEGVYLFRAAEAGVSGEAARLVFENLLRCFKDHLGEQSADWEALENGLSGNGTDLGRFLERILQNDARTVIERAGTWNLNPDALSLFALFWARPFRAEAARRLLDGLDVSGWRMGFCPVCGHWPSFGYLPAEGGKRTLRCAACATSWAFERIRCPFCLETDREKLPYLTVDDDQCLPVYVCESCKRYLKHRREEEGFPRQEDLDFILTATLDYAVGSQGYIQESLISVRFDEPDGESGRAYRAKAHYEEGPDGPRWVH